MSVPLIPTNNENPKASRFIGYYDPHNYNAYRKLDALERKATVATAIDPDVLIRLNSLVEAVALLSKMVSEQADEIDALKRRL